MLFGFAVNSGRIAGSNALEYIEKSETADMARGGKPCSR